MSEHPKYQGLSEELVRKESPGIGGLGMTVFGVYNDGDDRIETEHAADWINARAKEGSTDAVISQDFLDELQDQQDKDIEKKASLEDRLELVSIRQPEGPKIVLSLARPALYGFDTEVVAACLDTVDPRVITQERRVSLLSREDGLLYAPRDRDPISVRVEDVDDLTPSALIIDIGRAIALNRVNAADKTDLLNLMAEHERTQGLVGSFQYYIDEVELLYIRATFPMSSERASKVSEVMDGHLDDTVEHILSKDDDLE